MRPSWDATPISYCAREEASVRITHFCDLLPRDKHAFRHLADRSPYPYSA